MVSIFFTIVALSRDCYKTNEAPLKNWPSSNGKNSGKNKLHNMYTWRGLLTT